MRRLHLPFLLAALIAGAALAGCGSSSSSSPVDSELSYYPAGSPFVMTIATDPNSPSVKNAQGLLHSIPAVSLGETAVFSKLGQLGINYNSQIRPLFGNPLAVGALGTGKPVRALVVWITKDSDALNSLLGKFSAALQKVGSRDGATLYQRPGLAIAVDGATIVIANQLQDVTAALDRHQNSSGITSADRDRLVSGLGQDSLLQAFGSLSGVISSSPKASNARKVPWVGALRGYGASINASSSGLSFQYRLDTSGAPLTAAQVPLSPGASPPALAGTLPIAAGVSNPAHVFSFIESVEQATDPPSYASYLKQQASLRHKTGVDIGSLASLLTGDLSIESDTHTTMGRAAVSNAATATQMLSKLASDPKDVFPHATAVTRQAGGFYLVKEARRTIAVGLVGSELVAGNTAPAQLRAFAVAPAAPLSGAQGAAVFRISLPELIQLALHGKSSALGRAVLSTLGNITGWTSASTSSLTGNATLNIR